MQIVQNILLSTLFIAIIFGVAIYPGELFKMPEPMLLKMLGLYFYALIISHKCKMLSINNVNKLTLQKDFQNVVTNNVFMDKK